MRSFKPDKGSQMLTQTSSALIPETLISDQGDEETI